MAEDEARVSGLGRRAAVGRAEIGDAALSGARHPGLLQAHARQPWRKMVQPSRFIPSPRPAP